MNETTTEENDSIWYPPGGILIWLIVFVEVITFCMGIGSLVYDKTQNPDGFQTMQKLLHREFAFWNTIFLLTSGFLLAISVYAKENKKEIQFFYGMLGAIFFGFAFLFLKSLEFYDKWTFGYTLDTSVFFSYYWLLTGFHYLHVAVGIIILSIVLLNRKTITLVNLEAGGIFWHMCDLIWLILYPALYLIQ
ncbi:MAG: cytochrome c oxidase subunit 3 [Leptospira sp.]|uniref:Cytochrome c oxidase subunit 3 n=1 Tax=Leptospira paudalimensis TaxID=2950024 RepID=A0ABT3M373_9LEPT|nr:MULTISPECIES: cytochrome c oxidase subunit 3 [Leptospira]MBL0956005.1 cytochrome c oxidase subunit 3 [Leptospira sp.]MCW7502844.1 cytochrome c oxidase subunit 3 [Leptospira paudalimensis]